MAADSSLVIAFCVAVLRIGYPLHLYDKFVWFVWGNLDFQIRSCVGRMLWIDDAQRGRLVVCNVFRLNELNHNTGVRSGNGTVALLVCCQYKAAVALDGCSRLRVM